MTRRTFGKEELNGTLNTIGKNLKRSITCYLIGGGAMIFRGQKLSTKDIDLVVVDTDDLAELIQAMEGDGFVKVPVPEDEYRGLGARVVMENPKGMRFDLFEEVVCRKLIFSRAMHSRTTVYGTFGKLNVRLTSSEDIFLFKGATDRPDDLDDMSVLATAGLEWETIKKECLDQESGRNWASYLVTKLEQLEERYDVAAPIM